MQRLHIFELPWQDPAHAFQRLSHRPGLTFLDSAAVGDPRSEASYLCIDPVAEVVWREGDLADPFALLEGLTQIRRHQPAPLPFTGGVVGVLGYDLGRTLEPMASRHLRVGGPPELVARRYDTIVGFDHVQRNAWLMVWGTSERSAVATASQILRELRCAIRESVEPRSDWHETLPKAVYANRVRQVIEYIFAGDIFQANFTAPLWAERSTDFDPVAAYLALRQRNPAPFAAFIDLGGADALLCASPERFLRLSADGEIETRPIKGTAPRYLDPERDREAMARLAVSAKDRAENLMIVDLLRNDLGRVAVIGSITVPQLCAVESFASVHHLVSEVCGRLRPGLSAIDLLRACFPGGSITGAPKIRAMQIIDALEPTRRGPYCGSIVRIGYDGSMDSNIVIRSIVATGDRLLAQAGGGIVSDSDPCAEYHEMRLKVSSVIGECGISSLSEI